MMKDDAPLTLRFDEIGADDIPHVGGKGANLGVLTRAGAPVPPGFCVTVRAFERFVAALPDAGARYAALEALDGTEVEAARRAAEAMRTALERLPLPPEVAAAVREAWGELGREHPLAVRSSATAEDLPGASFAGQQDTYLNVRGEAALLDAVRRCWISLFTDRAVLYRARGGFGHRGVRLSVVVQRLVEPDVSGILFTADPVSGHRKIASIDAGFGLGEALVSGLISADLYRVDRRTRTILLARPGYKAFAIRSAPDGGTRQERLPEAQRSARALDDAQVLALAEIGDRIERGYGGVPQDIEWCIAGGEIHVLQARPITSLFPVPQAPDAGGGLRVFLSFGHLQMMLDPMPRLAREVWGMFAPVGKGGTPGLRDEPRLSSVVVAAGSRLFLDVTDALRAPRARRTLLAVLGRLYEELGRAAGELSGHDEFRAARGHPARVVSAAAGALGPVLGRVPWRMLVRDPAAGAAALDGARERLAAESAARVRARATPGARVRQCAVELSSMFGRIRPYVAQVLAGLVAHQLLARAAREPWAGEVRDDVEVLLRGLPGNVTTEMDLAVGDLTDLVRPHAELAALLDGRPWREVRPRLPDVPGGPEFLASLERFLEQYGDRGAGEIDVSRSRWRDDPSLLLRVVAGGVSSREAGSHRRQHQAQVAAGEAAVARLVDAARRGPGGTFRGWWIARLCRVARVGLGLREHPKFTIVRLLGVVRAEAQAAGALLAERGQLGDPGEVWHLGFDELARALDDPSLDLRAEAAAHADEYRRDRSLRPPIAISSDGEIPSLAPARGDLPAGALAGTAASAGVVEGVARVVLDPDRETLHAGEILVAPFTDPGWTPLFVHAAGVVTEVGGLMTHGAVVAREYGIPAVVSVASAVERIRTGQRIRVDGTRGFVEILDAP
jgi:pyruvate,water dikinase